MTPLNFVKKVFRDFLLLNAPEAVFYQFSNKYQIQLSLYGIECTPSYVQLILSICIS
jgi:hypothetical protein